jgi:hypothetical protein
VAPPGTNGALGARVWAGLCGARTSKQIFEHSSFDFEVFVLVVADNDDEELSVVISTDGIDISKAEGSERV